MKTTIRKALILSLVATSALAGSALADPAVVPSPESIVTLAPTQFVPDPSAIDISIPVQFARFGAPPHPGAAFAPFDTIATVPFEGRFTPGMGFHR